MKGSTATAGKNAREKGEAGEEKRIFSTLPFQKQRQILARTFPMGSHATPFTKPWWAVRMRTRDPPAGFHTMTLESSPTLEAQEARRERSDRTGGRGWGQRKP